jgi:autotransporter-associated beta strand protein
MNFDHGGSNIYVGYLSGNGSLSISKGATLTTASNLWLGRSGQGIMTMQDGHLSSSGWLIVGDNRNGAPTSTATMTVDGASTINMTSTVVGNGDVGIGVLNAGTAGAVADLILKGSSTLTNNTGNGLNIGYLGTGTLTLLGTAQVNENQTGNGNRGRFVIGVSGSGSNGTLTLGVVNSITDNPTFTVASTSAAVIGDAGSTVTVNINSGTFNGNSTAYIGFGYNGATVEWNQNGGLTNFPAGSSPFIGCGSGDNVTLNLNGGVFAIPYIKTDTTAGITPTVNINFNGGTLKANGSDPSASFPFINVRSLGTFNGTVQIGGAIWDTNGFTNTLAYPLVHDTTPSAPPIDGGLTKLGAGTLVLSAKSTYTGSTTVNDGTLQMKTTPLVMHQTTSTANNAAGNRGGSDDSAAGPFNLGMKFNVNTPIEVTQLGVFDDLGDGLAILLTSEIVKVFTKLSCGKGVKLL